MSQPEIIYSVDESIATITLNRPERMNALTPPLQAELHRTVRPGRCRPRGAGDHPHR